MNFLCMSVTRARFSRRVALCLWCALAGMMTLTACAHQATLKTPKEIAKAQEKKDKEAARKAKREEEKSQEVTVPLP